MIAVVPSINGPGSQTIPHVLPGRYTASVRIFRRATRSYETLATSTAAFEVQPQGRTSITLSQ